MEAELKAFLTDLKGLRREIKAENHERIAKQPIRKRAEQLASTWFDTIAKGLSDKYGFAPELIERYSNGSTRLIKLAEHNNLKKSYLETLDPLIRRFRDELILPIQRKDLQPAKKSLFSQFVASLSNPQENEYFQRGDRVRAKRVPESRHCHGVVRCN
jgi:hypothetical protein